MPRRRRSKKRRTGFRNFCVMTAILVGLVYVISSEVSLDSVIAALSETENGHVTMTDRLTPLSENEIRAHFIDVGQADAILIQSANNAVLIDGGEYDTRDVVINYLREAGITALDYVVATHPHADHIGGLAPVIREFDVKNVLMPNAINNTRTFEHLLSAIETKNIPATVPNVGDTIRAGPITFIVLAPGRTFNDLNNMSIALRMIHGETAFIFTGDAEAASEREILKTGLDLRADVLDAGHHGSRTSTTEDFFNVVNPKIVVISCGQDNKYGHPNEEILNLINQSSRDITLLRTDVNGTIVLTTDGNKIDIYKEKN